MIDSRASQPLTGTPRSNRMRASALIPEPAMPMMCTRPRSAGAGFRSVAALRTGAAPGASQSSGGRRRGRPWSSYRNISRYQYFQRFANFFGPAQLCDGKIKIGAWVRFVFQCVMPPLAIV